MKKSKKFLSILCTLCMILAMTTPAFAATPDSSENSSYTVKVNEYDVYVQTRAASTTDLEGSGLNEEAISAVKSNAIEDRLVYLSQLSTDELSDMGYDSNQIELLHNYKGERIESNPELRGIFADMECSFSCESASRTALTIRVSWNWTNRPVLFYVTDIVGIRWEGTNDAGQDMNLALNQDESECTEVLYDVSSDTAEYVRTTAPTTDDPYGHAYLEFNMSYNDGAGVDCYAKEGWMDVTIETTGTDRINEAAFVFAYGHSTFAMAPSISFPTSFSISFSPGMEKMCEEAIRVDSQGSITEY